MTFHLSVLALSSRFDGRGDTPTQGCSGLLSVLALSSRFDGRDEPAQYGVKCRHFQYSLCRVVLMVASVPEAAFVEEAFQYSLCRVVLMVARLPRVAAYVDIFQYSLCRVVLMVLSVMTRR